MRALLIRLSLGGGVKHSPRHILLFGLVILFAAFGTAAVDHALMGVPALAPDDGSAPVHEERDCRACQSGSHAAALVPPSAKSCVEGAPESAPQPSWPGARPHCRTGAEAARAPPARLIT